MRHFILSLTLLCGEVKAQLFTNMNYVTPSGPDHYLQMGGGTPSSSSNSRLTVMNTGWPGSPALTHSITASNSLNSASARAINASATGVGTAGFFSNISTTGFAGDFQGRVHVSDRLGIGTTNPTTLLSLGNSVTNRKLALYDLGSNFYGMGISPGTFRFEIPVNDPHKYGFYSGANEIMTLLATGQLGIGTTDPKSLLQAGNGISKLSMGSAYASALNWGTSYVGFNAARSGSTWHLDGDRSNNGGAMIYSTVGGALYFATVANNGGSSRTLTDAQVLGNVKMRVFHDGKVQIGNVGTASNDYLLFVKKGIATGKVFVNSSFAD